MELSLRQSAKPRVLIAAGVARSLIQFRGPLLQAFVDAGSCVATCAGEPDDETLRSLHERGISFFPVPCERRGLNPVRDYRYLKALQEVMRRFSPDVFLSYTVKPVVYGTMAASRFKVPKIGAMVTGAGAACPGPDATHGARVRAALIRALCCAALRRTHIAFFQNSDDPGLFGLTRCSDSPRAVTLAGTGVDLQEFYHVPALTQPVRFCCAARLLPEKGIREYVQAARAVRKLYPQVQFLLAGPLEQGSGLERRELDLWIDEGVIEYAGFVSDLRPLLAATSVFVLPSYYPEGKPRSIQEAMAMGRPVITSNSRGCREAIVDGVNGMMVPARNVPRLVQAMQAFIEAPQRIAVMGHKSRELAKERYDVHQINREILKGLGLEYPDGGRKETRIGKVASTRAA